MPKAKSRELLEFEIAFYERLVHAHPDFVDAWMALGDVYTRSKRYEQGLAVDLKLTELNGDNPVVWYNLACSYSLLRRVDEALEALSRAIELGYDDLECLMKDADLETLRRWPKFREFLERRILPRPS